MSSRAVHDAFGYAHLIFPLTSQFPVSRRSPTIGTGRFFGAARGPRCRLPMTLPQSRLLPLRPEPEGAAHTEQGVI